jgi:uncharacterized protein YjbI with pentapeptide repeats
MSFQIKNRFTEAVLFECELPAEIAEKSPGRQLGYAVMQALKARANLAGADLADVYLAGADLARADLAGAYLARADLAGADLARANLARAYLARANLARAYLAGADLAGADLAGAYLAGADLADVYLAGANLARAYLAGADLAGAYLAGADLAGANLAGAYLAGAYLAGAKNIPETNGSESIQSAQPYVRPTAQNRQERMLAFRERHPEAPVIEGLDAKILEVVTAGKGKLDMSQWHTCETTHCRAGWAITLAGDAGKKLEKEHGPYRAGAMIYRASTGRVPHFYASNERALEDMREQAALAAS